MAGTLTVGELLSYIQEQKFADDTVVEIINNDGDSVPFADVYILSSEDDTEGILYINLGEYNVADISSRESTPTESITVTVPRGVKVDVTYTSNDDEDSDD